MKKLAFLALTIALLIPFGACKRKSAGGDSMLPAGDYEFTGLVDNKNEVTMELEVNDEGKIKGRYGYTNEIKKSDDNYYTVKGSVFDKNKVTLYVSGLNGLDDTFETWNVFAEKEGDVVTLKGTFDNTNKKKIYNVVLSTDATKLDGDVKAPSVPTNEEEAEEQEAAEVKVEKKVEEPKKPLKTSPYPIAPGSHTFNGKAEGKYPIVVYLTVSGNGSVSGKMAYKSTLKKQGNGASSYMYFDGYFSGNSLHLDLTSSHGSSEEWDVKVTDNGSVYKLNGSAYSFSHDKSFSINVSGK